MTEKSDIYIFQESYVLTKKSFEERFRNRALPFETVENQRYEFQTNEVQNNEFMLVNPQTVQNSPVHTEASWFNEQLVNQLVLTPATSNCTSPVPSTSRLANFPPVASSSNLADLPPVSCGSTSLLQAPVNSEKTQQVSCVVSNEIRVENQANVITVENNMPSLQIEPFDLCTDFSADLFIKDTEISLLKKDVAEVKHTLNLLHQPDSLAFQYLNAYRKILETAQFTNEQFNCFNFFLHYTNMDFDNMSSDSKMAFIYHLNRKIEKLASKFCGENDWQEIILSNQLNGVNVKPFGKCHVITINNEQICLKPLRKPHCAINSLIEIEMLLKLRHVNVLSAKQFFEVDENFYFTIPYVACAFTLESFLSEITKLIPETNCNFIIREILRGLNYLHHKNLLHLEINAKSVFMVQNFIKIGNYESAITKNLSVHYKKPTKVKFFMSPEFIDDKLLPDTSDDIWSIGILYLTIISSTPNPFSNIFNYEDTNAVKNLITNFNINYFQKFKNSRNQLITLSPDQYSFLRMTNALNSKDRQSSSNLLGHKIFSNVNGIF